MKKITYMEEKIMYARQAINHSQADYIALQAYKRQREAIRQKVKQRKREEALYYIKQKLCGIVLISLGIVVPAICEDVTISVLIVPLGLLLLFTKAKAMIF